MQGFIECVFDQTELEACESRRDRWSVLATRFAAKEAVMKAIGTGWAEGVDFRDIAIMSGGGKKPTVLLSGTAKEKVDAVEGKVLVF